MLFRGWGAAHRTSRVSKAAIRAHVIRYFHDVFHIPISELKPNTDVHQKLPITEKAWRNLANVFNSLSGMKQLGVLLSPREMPGLNTIDDIVNAIWGKLNKVISVTGLSTGLQASLRPSSPIIDTSVEAAANTATTSARAKNDAAADPLAASAAYRAALAQRHHVESQAPGAVCERSVGRKRATYLCRAQRGLARRPGRDTRPRRRRVRLHPLVGPADALRDHLWVALRPPVRPRLRAARHVLDLRSRPGRASRAHLQLATDSWSRPGKTSTSTMSPCRSVIERGGRGVVS